MSGGLSFASSGGVLYGDVAEPAGEVHPAAPVSPYGIAKWVGEQYLQFFARQFGLKTVALRYANVYGPRQSPHGEAGVVAIFTTRMLGGQVCTIHGDGRYIRDYVYAGDVASANVRAIETDLEEGFMPFNIGTSTRIDVNELARQLRSLCQESLGEGGRIDRGAGTAARTRTTRRSAVQRRLLRLGSRATRLAAAGVVATGIGGNRPLVRSTKVRNS